MRASPRAHHSTRRGGECLFNRLCRLMLGLSQPWGFRAPERLFWIFVCWDLALSPGIQGAVSFLEKGSLEGRGAAGLFPLPSGYG